jgi:hypothetical protein
MGRGEFWDVLNPSQFAGATPLLEALERDLRLERGADPLRNAQAADRRHLSALRIQSAHDARRLADRRALEARQGVCQDFAHIMIALARRLAVPCRYVSGYLYRRPDSDVRSTDGATHAWAEALLPDVGWIGFDPTNNLVADEQHIRVAVGRDYADVPPTRGVFKGISAVRSELGGAVTVGTAWALGAETAPLVPWMSREATAPLRDAEASQQQ